jgi:hypothetical protein
MRLLPYTGTLQQDRQCTYNVILRRVYENIVAVGKHISVCMCGAGGGGGGGRVTLIIQHASPYCHLPPLFPHQRFRNHLINGTIWGGGGNVTEHEMWVLIFSTDFI